MRYLIATTRYRHDIGAYIPIAENEHGYIYEYENIQSHSVLACLEYASMIARKELKEFTIKETEHAEHFIKFIY